MKKDLSQAARTTRRLAKPGQQYVILCDANYYCSGFVLLIEDYLKFEDGTKNKHTHQACLTLNFLTRVC